MPSIARSKFAELLNLLLQRGAVDYEVDAPGHEVEPHASPLFGVLHVAGLDRCQFAVTLGGVDYLPQGLMESRVGELGWDSHGLREVVVADPEDVYAWS